MFNLLSEEWVLGTEIESAGTSGEGERSEGIEEAWRSVFSLLAGVCWRKGGRVKGTATVVGFWDISNKEMTGDEWAIGEAKFNLLTLRNIIATVSHYGETMVDGLPLSMI